jgi:YLP motif-containing protein 1
MPSTEFPDLTNNNLNDNKNSKVGININAGSNLFPIAFSNESNNTKDQSKSFNAAAGSGVSKIVSIESILHKPGRDTRPHKLCIILRGPPGSGKSFLANLIKQEEEKLAEKPKILSIDNYFISEQESKSKQILMKYEYDEAMDDHYQKSLVKSFKKTIDDDLFDFILVDMINHKMAQVEEMSQYAKQKRGFQTFIIELNDKEEKVYFDRNVHSRSSSDIRKIVSEWEALPAYYARLDCSFFLNQIGQEIEQVEMEEDNSQFENVETEVDYQQKSKWESEKTTEIEETSSAKKTKKAYFKIPKKSQSNLDADLSTQ